MERYSQESIEDLQRQIKNCIRLAEQPNLSAAARAALKLQIDRTQHQIQGDLKKES
jgi:hypothetical protein